MSIYLPRIDIILSAIGVTSIVLTMTYSRIPGNWPDHGEGALGSIVMGIGLVSCFFACCFIVFNAIFFSAQ